MEKQKHYVPSDELIRLALEFRKVKLWEKLSDTHLFAVRSAGGQTFYCNVMGLLGEYHALGVYPDDDSLQGLYYLNSKQESSSFSDSMEHLIFCTGLHVSFENKDIAHPQNLYADRSYCQRNGIKLRGSHSYPDFLTLKPYRLPWCLERPEDDALLQEALKAALFLEKAMKENTYAGLGFSPLLPGLSPMPLLIPEGNSYRIEKITSPSQQELPMPRIEIHGDLDRLRLKKTERTQEQWAMATFIQQMPANSDDEKDEWDMPFDAPFFPLNFTVVDLKEKSCIGYYICTSPENIEDQFETEIIRYLLEYGIPKEIQVTGERDKCLLSGLCKELGIKLTQKKNIPFLTEMIGKLKQDSNETEEDMDPDRLDYAIQQTVEMIRYANELNDLASIPTVVLQFLTMLDTSELPEDVRSIVLKEAHKRKLM